MTKFKTEKRKANVGERILITNTHPKEHRYANGDEFTVTESCDDGDTHAGGMLIFFTEYEVIIEDYCTNPSKPSKNERISLLESQVAELQAKVEALEKPKTIGINLRNCADIESFKLTPNEERKAVIERAKAFVTEVSERIAKRGHGNVLGKYGEITSNAKGWILRVNFVVNTEKKTVVALLYPFYSGSICTKAIAKCAPDDVFNADIGKAIALGRALGLDVSEFENAVKPTERVCGMTVLVSGEKYGRKLVKQYGGGDFTTGLNSFNAKRSVIIGDTEAQY